jgi:CRISPR/Cas system CSM-associated protein Csm3 (group 7 of RAMP superfamily)
MARKIARCLVVKGEIETKGPLHVGSADTGAEVDMPLAVNGRDQFYVPGTSLAGALRAWAERAFDADRIAKVWGSNDDRSGASFMVVDDAVVLAAPTPEILHGIGVDREWSTAAHGLKFDRQVLPRGTRLSFRLRLDVGEEAESETARGELHHLLSGLEAGEIGLGAAGTRGLGKIVLLKNGLRCTERNWLSRGGVIALLRDPDGGNDVRADWESTAVKVQPKPLPRIRIQVTWKPLGPLMSKAPRDGLAVDALPLVSALGDGRMALVLPGSGIKGPLRSQAERIVRTVLDRDVHWSNDSNRRHMEQLDLPLVRELFGNPRQPSAGKQGTTPEDDAQRGALAVDTCYAAASPINAQQWKEMISGEGDTASPKPLEMTGNAKLEAAFHVAVDRWTGGAADNLLFSSYEPFGMQWEPFVMTLDLELVRDRLAALALVWLLLRDLWERRVYVGFGVNRGYGDLEVETVKISGLGELVIEGLPGEIEIKPVAMQFEEAVTKLLAALQLEWKRWINENRNQEAA